MARARGRDGADRRAIPVSEGASAGRWAGVPCAELGVACRVTRGAGRGACARGGGAGLVEALRSGPDRAEPRRPGPAEERASGPGLRFGPGRIGLVGFREKGSGPRVWAAGLGCEEGLGRVLGSLIQTSFPFLILFPITQLKNYLNSNEFKFKLLYKQTKQNHAPA